MNVLKHSSVYVQIYICRLFSIRNECFTDNYSHPIYENGESWWFWKTAHLWAMVWTRKSEEDKMLETTLNQILSKNQLNSFDFWGIMEPLIILNKYSLFMLSMMFIFCTQMKQFYKEHLLSSFFLCSGVSWVISY